MYADMNQNENDSKNTQKEGPAEENHSSANTQLDLLKADKIAASGLGQMHFL